MTRDKRFVFRLSGDESSHLARLAALSQRTQADVIRCLIRATDTQKESPSIAQRLPANAINGLDTQQPVQATKSPPELNNAEFTFTA